ncbi:amidohydrolase [Luteimonas aestuarii]|uniref:Amidohydrolase n=1 Tax=Luteimonas aestuarii TaxID=453837 RepID=A0A4R5U1H8_9GAMM|nr:amidohydrolase [Luteimonas aestuarii]TDK27478.1 amidohydrolase [Luteimonas aestuarii]
MSRTLLLSCCLFALLPLQAAEHTLLRAARIHTSEPAMPVADAMVWDSAGRVVAVGPADELSARYPEATAIDVGDATVVPGLIDAHAHIVGLGLALTQADLSGARSKAEIVERLREYDRTLPEGAWMLGRGWDQNLWPEREFPTAADLDAAFPERPVWLRRVDGHAGWVNSVALRAVAADPASAALLASGQPDGGLIVRDDDGRPTGVFIDEAERLVEAVLPPMRDSDRDDALRRALEAAVRVGLTGMHDMGTSLRDFEQLRRFADDDRLPLRISAYADGEGAALDWLCTHGAWRHDGGRLQMRGVKLMVDGALGSRGAALEEDYSDAPGSRGLVLLEPERLEALAARSRDCGLQVATHAIGDRGNRLVLDAYAQVLGDDVQADHRWRIEHAQIMALGDIPRFTDLRLVASMQPTHATSDMPWAEDRVGPLRIAGAYAWRRFVEAGVPLALGSDFPVESPDPRLGLHAAVTRQDVHGAPEGGWLPDQVLSPSEALQGFTAGAAWANHDETRVGRLVPGLHADFVVLARDPMAVEGRDLADIPILSTWVDGRPVYEAAAHVD